MQHKTFGPKTPIPLRSTISLTANPKRTFLLLIFFVYFADALISYTAPSIIEQTINNNFLTGLIIALSSVAGLISDFIIPRVFGKSNLSRYFKYFLLFALGSAISIAFGPTFTFLFVLGMIFWGIYFDLLKFINFKLIKSLVTSDTYINYWSYHETVRTITVLTAPILAFLLFRVNVSIVFIVAVISLLLGTVEFYSLKREIIASSTDASVNPTTHLDVSYVVLLVKPIAPLYLFTISLIILDASFWTIGILLAEQIGRTFFLGNFIITAYTLPGIFSAFLAPYLAKKLGKKRSAFISAIFGSLILFCGLTLMQPTQIITVVFTSSLFFSLCWPQIYSAFEDYIVRVGRHSDDMISIQDSANNIGYIAGPIIAGLLASSVGYLNAFKVVSIFPLIFAIIGIITMDHKVRFSRQITR